MTDSILPAKEGQGPEAWGWQLLVIPAVFLLWRCLLASAMELSGDEAYYWVWSRHLAGGYFDHPPMVAWLIRAATALLGENEFAVRLPAAMLGAGTLLAGAAAMRAAGASRRAQLSAQLLLLLSPLVQVAGAVMTPDIPSLFFTTAAVAAALYCLRSTSLAHWTALGLCCGGAMLSKYTALLPSLALLLVLLLHEKRNLLRCVYAGLVATAVLLPLLAWNYRHDWVSFAFQLHHGVDRDDRMSLANLAGIAGAQVFIATPVLFVLAIWFAGWGIKRSADPVSRLLSITGLATLGFFCLTSLRHKVEANWPMLAWPPLLLLVVYQVERATSSARLRQWYRRGLVVAAVSTLVVHLPPGLLLKVNSHLPLNKIGGWRSLSAQLSAVRGNRPMVARRYTDASWLSFYLPGHPEVPVLRPAGGRRSQFDLLPCDLRDGDEALIIGRDPAERDKRLLMLNGRPVQVKADSATPFRVQLYPGIFLERYAVGGTIMAPPAQAAAATRTKPDADAAEP